MSSGTVVDEMVVKLNGDNSDFVKMWKDSIGQVQSAVSAIKATIAGWGLYSLVNKAVNAFAEAEDVAIKLNATLKANGRDVEKVGEDYAKFANTMQSLTRVDDDAVAGLLQVAETMGITGEAAKRAAQNAIGLAAARGISAQAAIRMTVALEQGTTTMLTRQFPALRKVKNESERLALAHKLVGNTFEVAKASAGGMAGQYDQLSNAIGNVWEDFGEVAVKFVKPVVSWVKDVATAFRDMLPVIKESADWFINKYQDVWKSFKLGFAVVFGLFYNFKENTAVLSAWWVENWQKALQVFGNVLVKGTSATINNLWVLLEFFVSEAVIWFGQSGYDMAVSWGTALETTMAEQAAKAYSSALRQLGRTDEAFNVMSNFYTERAQKEKAADAKAADTKKQREKEYETRRKAAGGRLVSITKTVMDEVAGLKPPPINLKNPLLDAVTGNKPKEVLAEAKKFEGALKKTLPFYGINDAVRAGTDQYKRAVESTVKLLAKTSHEVPGAAGPIGAAAKAALNPGGGKGPAPFKIGVGDGSGTSLGDLASAERAAAARRVASGQAAMSARDASAQASSFYDRRRVSAIARVEESGKAQKAKTETLLEQIRDAIAKNKGDTINIVPANIGDGG